MDKLNLGAAIAAMEMINGMVERHGRREPSTMEELKRAVDYFDRRTFEPGEVVMVREEHARFCGYSFPLPGEPALVLKKVTPGQVAASAMFEEESIILLAKCSKCPLIHRVPVDPVHFTLYKAPEPKEEPQPEPEATEEPEPVATEEPTA